MICTICGETHGQARRLWRAFGEAERTIAALTEALRLERIRANRAEGRLRARRGIAASARKAGDQ